MEIRRDRLVGRAGSLTWNTVAIEDGFDPVVVFPNIALVELDVLGRDCDLHRLLAVSVQLGAGVWPFKERERIRLACNNCLVPARNGVGTIDRLLQFLGPFVLAP